MRRFRTATREVELAGRTRSPAHAGERRRPDQRGRLRPRRAAPLLGGPLAVRAILAEELSVMRLRGQRVLELGCGLGFVAMGAVIGGADVTATDYYEDATRFALVNVAEATGKRIVTRMVNWVELPADLGKFDVVIASDVLTSTAMRRSSRTRSRRRSCAVARRSWPTQADRAAGVPRRVRARPGARERSASLRRWRDQADGDALEIRWGV